MLTLIAALVWQPAAPERITCPGGAIVLPTEGCPITADHRLPVFRLFFDSGSSEIRREWEEVIDQAAGKFPGPGTRFRVDAYSDTSGSAAVNQRLAVARAGVVADGLQKRGIARDRISIQVHGENRLLIPTADGVREIQNRRVEIVAFP